MNPALLNLLIFGASVALIYLVYRSISANPFWHSRIKQTRTLTEDMLKQLYHVEQSGQKATLDRLSGALQLSRKKSVRVIESMTSLNLIKITDNQIFLTKTGRDYAVRIVRIHRLWEKYLAERTGHKPKDWHQLAERKEHELNEEQTAALEASLGNPLYDPHGDPIPSQAGEVINPVDWIPLPSYPVDVPAKIAHIEDEPEVIYQQILDERLFIDSHIKVLKKDHDSVTFLSEGKAHKLSAIVAANIHCMALTTEEVFEESAIRLSALTYGEKAEVIGLSKECRGANRRRLLDLGIIPGTKIEVELKSPLADPVAYKVRNTSIALRNTLADLILINKKLI